MDFAFGFFPFETVGPQVGAAIDGLLVAAYFATLIPLALLGLHRYWLVYLYFSHRDQRSRPPLDAGPLPPVTVQLPIYNEKYVVGRLIEAVCALDYPTELLSIQVLDDSTDETVELASRLIAEQAARGVRIEHLRRPNREGFKAGALQFGLARSRDELLVVFDADFAPAPDCLLKMVPFFSDPSIGMVQVRWGHLNRDYSLLTRAQAILLDGHFVLESGARSRSGRFFNFNGTAGMWRRRAIEEAGGWQHDTLTEDLDLSYRAQLAGWKFVFLQDVTAPAEVPVDMNSFKSQQYRWAKGSAQTALKLLPRILKSSLPFRIKSEAFFHLCANLAYPLMVVLALLLPPVIALRLERSWPELLLLDLPLFAAATLSVGSFYLVSQREIATDWMRRIVYLPVALALGIGVSLNNGKGVLEALLGVRSPFLRTPKFGVRRVGEDWKRKSYRAAKGWTPWLELLLGLHFVGVVALCALSGLYWSLPFLGLFMFGFLATGLASLVQSSPWTDRLSQNRHTPVSPS